MGIFEAIGAYFAHILLALVVITGVVVLLAKIFNWSGSTFVEYCQSLFPVFFIVFVLRSFIVEPYRIPSGSMLPTLEVGDYILVSKYKYGIRFPVWNKKIIETGQPQRGDMIVFRFPEDLKTNYIKRLIGLPGDELRFEDKQVYLNGKLLTLKPDGIYEENGFNQFVETLGDIEHKILIDRNRPNPAWRIEGKTITIPEGHYFVMGDNRDQSYDSRFWGLVPDENLVGKAFFIWMSLNQGPRRGDDAGEGLIDWERMGTKLNP